MSYSKDNNQNQGYQAQSNKPGCDPRAKKTPGNKSNLQGGKLHERDIKKQKEQNNRGSW